MTLSIEEIASAFSGHDFALTYPHLAEDVRWNTVGGSDLSGRDAVIAACAEASRFLQEGSTTFVRWKVVVGKVCVVVDAVAEYVDKDGESSTVSSCDLYDFRDRKVCEITSYNVEIAP